MPVSEVSLGIMGQRTTYYQSRSGKTLWEHLEEEYSSFWEWMLEEHEMSQTNHRQDLISEHLTDFLISNRTLPAIRTLPQKMVDELTDEFFSLYCDYGPGRSLFEMIGPMMNTWRYSKASAWIAQCGDAELISLWNVLIHGRSVLNHRPFICRNGRDDVLGFWKREELQILQFKPMDEQQKGEFRDGIDYLLHAIEKVDSWAPELIVSVDK